MIAIDCHLIRGGCRRLQFWTPNEFNVKGGVDFGFMSTTLDERVAMGYASRGRVRVVFEMQMGMIDRGANLSWLSQYPFEQVRAV